jgi:YfiH family protein
MNQGRDLETLAFVTANWPVPKHVHALTTTRTGGRSKHPYDSLNLATHVGDEPDDVRANRALLRSALQLPSEPLWLEQVHGTEVISVSDDSRRADGIYANRPGAVCTILTADCLPVLLCDPEGTEICALHGGWRGLAGSIIQHGVDRMSAPPASLMVWLGPAISVSHYEVGAEVRAAFVHRSESLATAFRSGHPEHFFCDLYAIARHQLRALGVTQIHGGDFCTFADKERFYSYRRDGGGNDTGRMATLIWLDA